MKAIVNFFFDHDQNFYHFSLLYVGLNELARRGTIELRYLRNRDGVGDPSTACMEISHATGTKPVRLAIDLRDQSDLYSQPALTWSDIYFKRNLFHRDLNKFPVDSVDRVRPFGLNFACRTSGCTARLFRNTLWHQVFRGVAGLRQLRHHLDLPHISEFEQLPSADLEPAIVFQTRVWEEDEAAPGESEEINSRRVAVVRALREAFGKRFRGGLVPTPLALARYPNEISQQSSKRKRYTAMCKRNLIGIYTQGLFQSNAFKLPEYLAASQCIVAEPIRNQLPEPLVAGKHFLPFGTLDECVSSCQKLLRDVEFQSEMRHANYEYYKTQIMPSSLVGNLIASSQGLSNPGKSADIGSRREG